MQQVPLTFYERFILWNLCGNHQVANLKEAAVYLRLIERLRPSDEEMRETRFTGDGRNFQWQLPREGYGNLVAALEDEEAKALAAVIEGAQPVRVNDAVWMLRLTASMRPEPAMRA